MGIFATERHSLHTGRSVAKDDSRPKNVLWIKANAFLVFVFVESLQR